MTTTRSPDIPGSKVIVHHIADDAPARAPEHYAVAIWGRNTIAQLSAVTGLHQAGCYRPVAEINTAELETAWRLTNNLDVQWSLAADPRARILAPLYRERDGRVCGLRSSMVGDLFAMAGRFFVAAPLGFIEVAALASQPRAGGANTHG